MDFKWKINGDNLVVHNKATGEIYLISPDLVTSFEKAVDYCIKDFLTER